MEQQEQWENELSQEKKLADLSLEEIRDVIRLNPGGGSIGFYRDRLRAYRSLRNWLRRKCSDKIATSIISAIILANPGLTRTEYDLLINLHEKLQLEQIAYNVAGVARAYDGTIVYLTGNRLSHALQRHEQEFGYPNKGDFASMVIMLLQREPDSFQGNRWVYKIKYKSRNLVLAIAIDQKTGMITTVFSVYK